MSFIINDFGSHIDHTLVKHNGNSLTALDRRYVIDKIRSSEEYTSNPEKADLLEIIHLPIIQNGCIPETADFGFLLLELGIDREELELELARLIMEAYN